MTLLFPNIIATTINTSEVNVEYVYFYLSGICFKRRAEYESILEQIVLPTIALQKCQMIWTSNGKILKCEKELRPYLKQILETKENNILKYDVTSYSKANFIKLLEYYRDAIKAHSQYITLRLSTEHHEIPSN